MTSEPGSLFTATVDELVDTFREALISLLPSAERALLTWTDADTHDDWEYLAAACFRVFVANPINLDRYRPQGMLPLAPYDFDFESYEPYSWIDCEVPGRAGHFAFVRLLTDAKAFDRIQLVKIDPSSHAARERILLPWGQARFKAVRRTDTGMVDEMVTTTPIE